MKYFDSKDTLAVYTKNIFYLKKKKKKSMLKQKKVSNDFLLLSSKNISELTYISL